MGKTGNIDQLFRETRIIVSELLDVFSWSPGRAEDKLPCTEVHVMGMKPKHGNMAFVLRLKSRAVCQGLIDALIKHRDDVWPEGMTAKQEGEK